MAKFDLSSPPNILWAIRDGSSDEDQVMGIATSNNSILLTGFFTCGTGAFRNLSCALPPGGRDIFVAKFETSLPLLTWAVSAGTAGSLDSGSAITVLPSNSSVMFLAAQADTGAAS